MGGGHKFDSKTGENDQQRLNNGQKSGGIKRDKLKGINGAKFAVFIFADFRFSWNYSMSEVQVFAEILRFSQKPVCPI